MHRLSRALAVVIAIVGASDASAQTTSRRPYRGLFGGGMAEDARQSLVVNGSMGGGWDDNILLDLPGGGGNVDPRIARRGSVGSLSGSMSYSRGGEKGSLGASVGSSARYYPSQAEPFVAAHGASIGGAVRLGRRTNLTGSQSVNYQPFTFASFLPGLAPPLFDVLPELGDLGASVPENFFLDQSTSSAAYLSYASQAALSHQFTTRVGSYLTYNFQHSDTAFFGGSFRSQGGGGGISIRLTQGLFARVGYVLQQTSLALGGTVRAHNADFGVNFNKALSFSRRTTVAFSSGTTGLSNGVTTTYQLIGGVGLNHELGRTWTASAGYNRSVQLIDLLLQPVISDSVQASAQGLFTRRVQAQVGFLASIGTVGFRGQGTSTGQYDTTQASAGVSYALSRFAQLSLSYAYYRYGFDQVVLPGGVPANIDRQSIRANLNVWAPIINQARRR